MKNKLQDLYSKALKDLEFASIVLIDDGGSDESVELLLTEAMYSIACFSRALRATNYDTILKDKLCNLKILLNQNILLMEGAGIKRLQAFLQCFFNESRLDDVFKNIKDTAQAYYEVYELKDDDFEQRVFDCFLFYDRFCCLTHPIDSPIKTNLDNCQIWKDFEDLLPVFSIYSTYFETYLLNVCIPDEHEYRMWFSLGLCGRWLNRE